MQRDKRACKQSTRVRKSAARRDNTHYTTYRTVWNTVSKSFVVNLGNDFFVALSPSFFRGRFSEIQTWVRGQIRTDESLRRLRINVFVTF